MTRLRLILYAIAAVVAALLIGYGLGYLKGIKRQGATAGPAEIQAARDGGQADAFKEQSKEQDPKNALASKRLAEARAKLAKAEAALARVPVHAPVEVPPSVDPPQRVDSLAPVVVALKEVVAAQDEKIAGLTISLNLRDKIIAAQDRQIAGQQIAMEALKAANKSALWRGRFQGFAMGIGSDYIAGRLK